MGQQTYIPKINGSTIVIKDGPPILSENQASILRDARVVYDGAIHAKQQRYNIPKLGVGSTVTLTELCKKGKHKGTIQEVKWQVVAYVTLSNRRHLHLKCLDNPHRADQFVALSRIEKELG